jgi:ABC-type sugar transport system ATPase subunit
MLELLSLTKKFGTTVAVNNLNFITDDCKFITIFGPAGAGKTTTLRLIAGILQPSSGDIYYRGRSLRNIPPENRNMSMAFENYALYSHLSVYENLAFPLRARSYPDGETKSRVQWMANVLQISELLNRLPGNLSGGQRQRVALGRALIRDADVYLLDEPISHLDAKLRHRMRGELKAMCAKKNSIVVYVTHDSREAMALSERVIVMNKGILIQVGTPEEIFKLPVNEFVAGFVGEPPMSFLDVEFEQENGNPVYRILGNNNFISATPGVSDYLTRNKLTASLRLGVRATELSVSPSNKVTHNVSGEVYITETLGYRNVLTVRLGNNLVQVVTPPEVIYKIKDKVWLDLNSENVHVFCGGDAIAHPPGRKQ